MAATLHTPLLTALLFVGFSLQAQISGKKPVSSHHNMAESEAENKYQHLMGVCEKLENEAQYAAMLDSSNLLIGLASNQKNKNNLALAFLKQAAALRRLSRFNDSRKATDKAFNLYSGKAENSEAYSKVMTSYSIIFRNFGKPDSSIIYGNRALAIDSTLRLPGLSNSYNNLGLAYMDKGNFKTAILHLLQGLKIAEKEKNRKMINRLIQNLGACYSENEEWELARKYHKLNFENQKQTANRQTLAVILANLGNVEFNDQKPEQALAYYKSSFQYAREAQFFPLIAGSLINISHIQMNLGLVDSACQNAAMGLELVESKKIIQLEADAHIALGKCHQEKGMNLEAKGQFEKGYTLAKYYGNLSIYKKAIAALKELGEQSGDFALAYQYSNRLQKLKDSLAFETNRKTLYEIEVQYQTEKKDKEIAQQKLELTHKNLLILEKEKALEAKTFSLLLQQEATKRESALNELLLAKNQNSQLELENKERKMDQQKTEAMAQTAQLTLEKRNQELENKRLKDELFRRNSIIGGGFFLFVLIGMGVNSIRLKKRLELQQAILDQRKRLSADLHDDVGATLSSISIYTEAIKNKLKNNEPERVMELVNKIGENARETISTLGDIVWNLNPNNDNAERLFARMESTATLLLSAQNTLLEFEVDSDLKNVDFSLEAKQNLYLIFKETINNAAKYARASVVKASIKKQGNKLEMSISDNGTGFDPTQVSEGNGLRNIRLRSEGMKGTSSVVSNAQGTGFLITLPLSALSKA